MITFMPAQRVVGAQLAQHVEAAALRHHHVEHAQVGLLGARDLERLPRRRSRSAPRSPRAPAGTSTSRSRCGSSSATSTLAVCSVSHRRISSGGLAAVGVVVGSGTVIAGALDRARLCDGDRCPPWASTMPLQMASPRPVPGIALVGRVAGAEEALEQVVPGRPRPGCRCRCRCPIPTASRGAHRPLRPCP